MEEAGGDAVEEELRLPVGQIPELPPKALSPEAIEAWREEARRDLLRRGLLEALLSDPTRTPRPPRFRLVD
jgi:hypothetical protein